VKLGRGINSATVFEMVLIQISKNLQVMKLLKILLRYPTTKNMDEDYGKQLLLVTAAAKRKMRTHGDIRQIFSN
jgi:hypothetical protein